MGLVMCFVGTKFIVLFVTLVVFSTISFIVIYILYYQLGLQSKEKESELYVSFYFSIFVGLVISCRFFIKFKKNVIWLLGAFVGIYCGRLLSLTLASQIRRQGIFENQN